MKRLLLYIFLLLSFTVNSQILGRIDISEVVYVDDTTWTIAGTISDPTGSYTGLSVIVGDKIIMRGIDSVSKVVFDRFKIVEVTTSDVLSITAKIRSDVTEGILNNSHQPLTGAFPIGASISGSKLTLKPSMYQTNIDPDYDAGVDNLNLKEVKTLISTGTSSSAKCSIEASTDAENNWSVPFTLNSSAVVFYNGVPLRSTQWSGTTTLNVAIDTRKYDHLVIIN